MDIVKSKVYYVIETGEVLVITPESMGAVVNTTKEQDYNQYEYLQKYPIDKIDYLELEFGTLSTIFKSAKSYSVDVETKELNIVYYTPEELEEKSDNYTVTMEEKIQSLRQDNADLLMNSVKKDLEIQQLQKDIADLTKQIALGGNE